MEAICGDVLVLYTCRNFEFIFVIFGNFATFILYSTQTTEKSYAFDAHFQIGSSAYTCSCYVKQGISLQKDESFSSFLFF